MANKLIRLPGNRLFNNSNIATPGGTATLYLSGTTTPAAFVDADGTSLGSTLTANALGQLPDAYGDETVAYRLILKDAAGIQLDGGDIDPFYFGRVDLDTLALSSGSSLVGTKLSATGATARTVADKLAESVSVKDFGAKGDGTTDDTSAIQAALDYLSTLGGGKLLFPAGVYLHTGLQIGDGTNTTQSTKHHNIHLIGAGIGSSPSVSNVQTLSPTVLRYTGPASSTAAVLEFAGPMHGVGLQDLELDANGLAGIGLKTVHVDDFTYRNVTVRNWTANNYVFTTRSGNVTGAAHGCSNASLYDCNAYDPASNAASGILLTSGVSTGTSLVGMPDTANLDIYGGVFFYGGSTGTSGIEFAGCDNNSYSGTQFLSAGGNDGGGKSHKWTQWPASPAFPLGNQLRLGGFNQGMTGTAGTGGNMAWYDPSDSGYLPTIAGLSSELIDGRRYVNGQRVYSVYSVATAELNSSTQSTTSATFADIPGMSLTLNYPAGSKLRLSFTGLVAKNTTGTGDFVLNFNGTAYGQTTTRVASTGFFGPSAMELLVDLPGAGSGVAAKVQFKSDGTNALQISCGVLIATVLY